VARSATPAAELRARLGHPVIDSDGHLLELIPVLRGYFFDVARELGGSAAAIELARSEGLTFDERVLRPWSGRSEAERRERWASRPPFWSLPVEPAIDRATGYLPRLLHERLDDMGLDFAVLYPSRTLPIVSIPNAELRQLACRAVNRYHAELYAEFADRLAPVAVIPMHTPEEAIAELEAAKALGLRSALLNGVVHRPLADGSTRPDSFGIDSPHDYDPVWARCVELGLAPAFHASGQGWGSRRSISSYVYNHIGSFGASGEAVCKSLFLGGVTRRFPGLCFAALEGGVAWACSLSADLVSHWEKRNAGAMRRLDPAALDVDAVMGFMAKYGDARIREQLPAIRDFLQAGEPAPPRLDEWAAVGVERAEELADLFVPRFYFGCEADDPSVAWAFDARLNPFGARLRPLFSSDIGHWDVPDMLGVLPEAHELVDDGHITPDDFRELTFENAVRFYASLNPDFFRGTRVEREAAELLATTPA